MTAQDTPTPGYGVGSSAGSDYGTTGNTGTGTSTGTAVCPTCGQPTNRGLEQFLGRLGITDDMINNLKSSFQNIDVDEYINTARDYLKSGSTKAKPRKVSGDSGERGHPGKHGQLL